MKHRQRHSGLLLIALTGLCLVGVAQGMAATDTAKTKTHNVANAVTALPAPLSAVAEIGKKMFFDTSLSGNGKMSCATCHVPNRHYGPPGDTPVFYGGLKFNRPGLRTVPSLTYKQNTPTFSIGEESAAEEAMEASPMSIASGKPTTQAGAPVTGNPLVKAQNAGANKVPQGGMFWDGRAAGLEDQAFGPLLSPSEMANKDEAALYKKIMAHYGKDLAALFGQQTMADRKMALAEAGFALTRYQIEEPSFHPYTSKYDAYLRHQASLTAQEMRGLKLFNDPKKGNCNACHLSAMKPDGGMPDFTDFEYEALGVPRNPQIPANKDPHYFDLGICGPLRDDSFAKQKENCGLFKTPTLRNVATRQVFFHNGRYDTLEDVVRFYVDRDTRPETIYPHDGQGKVILFDDLPKQYQANIDHIDAPMDRKRGDQPALSDAEIKDIVAFLRTLTDGWSADKAETQESSEHHTHKNSGETIHSYSDKTGETARRPRLPVSSAASTKSEI